MRAHVCGARGSTPAPGAEFARYGGHTSCLALARAGEAPSLVLDAGTGLRRLTGLLDGRAFRGTIVCGHLHWDHTQGLPFFAGGDRPGARVRLLLPAQGDPVEVLSRLMSPPHFPVDVHGLQGDWEVGSLEPGHHELEGWSVLALDIPHKGGRTFGLRVSDGEASLAYLSDHSPLALGPGPVGLGAYHRAALALVDGVDVLFHDAQHTARELPARAHFGHSAAEYAVGLGERAGAGRVVLFHHDPNRTDDDLDALVAGFAGAAVAVSAAVEGTVVEVAAVPPGRAAGGGACGATPPPGGG